MNSHSLLLPALGLGLLPFTLTHAQEALVGALELDGVLQGRARPPAGKMLGPLTWSAAGSLRVEYNDNFRQRSIDPLADVILRPGVDLGLAWPISQRAVLSFGFGLQYLAYLDYSEYSRLEISPDSAVSLSFTAGDVVITVFNQISYTEEVISDPEVVDQATYPRLNNQVGVRATWTIGDWQLQGGVTHVNFWPQDDEFSDLERMSQQVFLRGAYLIAPQTRVGVEGSASFTDYVEELRRDFNSYSVGPFVEWTILDGLQVTARGGGVLYEFYANSLIPTDETLDSYYFGGSVSHRLTDFIQHSASARHDLRVGLNTEVTESTLLRYDIRWQMTEVWDVSAGTWYELGKRPEGSRGLDETYDRYGVDAGIGRQITGRLTARAGYRYTRRESNLANRGYDQNLVHLTARYRF